MRKEIKEINKEKKIIRITTPDERWYVKEENGQNLFYPSTTWICSYYPKTTAFMKWFASKGFDEAQLIKEQAGSRGHKVHQGITDLIEGKTLPMDTKYPTPNTGELEELTVEEYEYLISFDSWYKEAKPVIHANEIVVWNEEHRYAGTVDLICEINNILWLIDLKTSKSIWPSHETQVSAYKHCMDTTRIKKLGILQIGYPYNRKKWKLTEIPDQFDLFLASKRIWEKEVKNKEPLQKDLPMELKLEN